MPIIFDRSTRLFYARNNHCTAIGCEICPDYIDLVWDAAIEYMRKQLCCCRGVKIPGLASISFKAFRNNISTNVFTIEKIPYLQLSEQLMDMYALQPIKRPLYSLAPTTGLNLSWIACRTGIHRRDVEMCVEEVVHAFRRALVKDCHVEFRFEGIGKIVVSCNKVKSAFEHGFLCEHGFGTATYVNKYGCGCV